MSKSSLRSRRVFSASAPREKVVTALLSRERVARQQAGRSRVADVGPGGCGERRAVRKSRQIFLKYANTPFQRGAGSDTVAREPFHRRFDTARPEGNSGSTWEVADNGTHVPCETRTLVLASLEHLLDNLQAQRVVVDYENPQADGEPLRHRRVRHDGGARVERRGARRFLTLSDPCERRACFFPGTRESTGRGPAFRAEAQVSARRRMGTNAR